MRSRTFWLLPLLLVFVPATAIAQLPVAIALEGRLGWAVPQGDFAEGESGLDAGGGPSAAIGARIDPLRFLGVFAAYQQTWFDCGSCPAVALDESAVMRGYEAGLKLSLPMIASGLTPWVRGAVTQQTLGLSRSGETFTSEASIGFTGSAGITIPLAGRFEISPGLRYQSAPAEFDFESLPDRDRDVSAFVADITLGFRL